jgi:hypothetical protein
MQPYGVDFCVKGALKLIYTHKRSSDIQARMAVIVCSTWENNYIIIIYSVHTNDTMKLEEWENFEQYENIWK